MWSILVTLFGIVGAVVREEQRLNVLVIVFTGFPAILEIISPYVVFEVSFTLTPQPFCNGFEDQLL